MYARDHVRPTLNGMDIEKLEKLYSELRRESMVIFSDLQTNLID